jgi:hypothetical protein
MTEHALTDVTMLLATEQQQLEEELFEAFQEAFAVATSKPSVRAFRACVAAYDEYYAAVCEGVTNG